jgi:hypothetical protein
MNDKDLERQLRSQHGPREQGYAPSQLPMSLDTDRAGSSGQSRLNRFAVLVPAAVAGALAVGVVSWILATPGSNGVGGTASASPSASSTPIASTDASACAPQEVVFAAEPWGGAAGSRGTVVSVSLQAGRSSCHVSTGVYGRITDADGNVLISSTRFAMRYPSVLLRPGDTYAIGVAWSNWCGDQPPSPLAFQVRLDDTVEWITVSQPAGAPAIPVAPCMGEESAGHLSVTNLQPAP